MGFGVRIPVNCHHKVEPMQWRHLNVFNKEFVIVSVLRHEDTVATVARSTVSPRPGGAQPALQPSSPSFSP
jgi:hypothetical protein